MRDACIDMKIICHSTADVHTGNRNFLALQSLRHKGKSSHDLLNDSKLSSEPALKTEESPQPPGQNDRKRPAESDSDEIEDHSEKSEVIRRIQLYYLNVSYACLVDVLHKPPIILWLSAIRSKGVVIFTHYIISVCTYVREELCFLKWKCTFSRGLFEKIKGFIILYAREPGNCPVNDLMLNGKLGMSSSLWYVARMIQTIIQNWLSSGLGRWRWERTNETEDHEEIQRQQQQQQREEKFHWSLWKWAKRQEVSVSICGCFHTHFAICQEFMNVRFAGMGSRQQSSDLELEAHVYCSHWYPPG